MDVWHLHPFVEANLVVLGSLLLACVACVLQGIPLYVIIHARTNKPVLPCICAVLLMGAWFKVGMFFTQGDGQLAWALVSRSLLAIWWVPAVLGLILQCRYIDYGKPRYAQFGGLMLSIITTSCAIGAACAMHGAPLLLAAAIVLALVVAFSALTFVFGCWQC